MIPADPTTTPRGKRFALSQPGFVVPFSRKLLEHLLATFLQCRAAALPLLLDQGTHSLDVFQHRIEFDNFLSPQLLPAD